MPATLSAIAIAEKNKLATTSRFLVCLKITIPGIADPVRLVADNEDLDWHYGGASVWTAFPFEIDEISDTSKGEIPRLDIRVGNASRVMEYYLYQYDQYCKDNGYEPIEVEIYVINTAVVANNILSDPEVSHVFELKQPRTDSQWATFTLGAPNLFNKRFPVNRMLRNACRFKFKGADGRCGYTGGDTSCDRTLSDCRSKSNSERYGGTPGIGQHGFTFAGT